MMTATQTPTQTPGQTRSKDLESMLKLLADQKAKSRDYVAQPSAVEAVTENGKVKLHVRGGGVYTPTNWSFGQLATFADVPKQYADRIAAENPRLLADNFNHGLRKADARRVIRTVGDTMRALVSDRYFALDSFDLLRETLPALFDGGFQVQQSELSDRRLYIRAVSPRTTTEVAKGDAVQFGVSLSTSDVGGGALKVEPFFFRLACLNGMVVEERVGRDNRRVSVSHRHSSAAIDFEGDTFTEFLTDETREKKAAAIYSEARDLIVGLSNVERFREIVTKMQDAAARPITNNDVKEVVAKAMTATGVTGSEMTDSIIGDLLRGNQGAGFSQWGLANSFTAQAHNTADSELADQLMRAGGRIINMSADAWKRVAA